MDGGLIEILILVAVFVLTGLLGGKKRRTGTGPDRPPLARPRAPRPVGASATSAPVRREVPERRPDPVSIAGEGSPGQQWINPQSMVQDIVDLLEQQRRLGQFEEGYSEEQSFEVEPEVGPPKTVELAGGASHQRFHDQYVPPLARVWGQAPGAPAAAAAQAAQVQRLRQAVVWSEILGRPKGWSA